MTTQAKRLKSIGGRRRLVLSILAAAVALPAAADDMEQMHASHVNTAPARLVELVRPATQQFLVSTPPQHPGTNHFLAASLARITAPWAYTSSMARSWVKVRSTPRIRKRLFMNPPTALCGLWASSSSWMRMPGWPRTPVLRCWRARLSNSSAAQTDMAWRRFRAARLGVARQPQRGFCGLEHTSDLRRSMMNTQVGKVLRAHGQ